MYLRYFGFETYPFSVTPDPAFLYLSPSHRDALAHLLYGAGEHGGFVSLIGEVGTGKTTLIRSVVDSDLPDLDIALCWNPQLEVREFVATICDELGVPHDEQGQHTSLKALTDRLNRHLLASHARNRRTVLIVDEAQNLSRDVLEQLRLLTNLETHKHKLLRIILVGQPELSTLLARHDLRQLAQRITARSVLKPLGVEETRAYVQHRLACANGPQHLFSRGATYVLRFVTGGVPRLINMVCERALMGAYAHGRSGVGAWMMLRAAMESLPRRAKHRLAGWWRVAVPTGALAAVLVVAGLAWLPEIPLTNAAESAKTATAQADDTGAGGEESTADEDAGSADAASSPADPGTDNTSTPGTSTDDASADKQASDSPAATASDASSETTASSDPGRPKPSEDDDAAETDRDPASKPSADSSNRPAAAPAKDEQKEKSGALSPVLPAGGADLNQLLRLWGVFGAEVHSQCRRLNVGDLRCLADTGDLDRLARYNRPALLVVRANGQQRTVLLTALNAKKATVVGADGTLDVSPATLKAHWTGRFQVVWRTDAGVRLIQPGSVGNAVVWLRNRLDEIDGDNPEARAGKPSPVYDAALGQRVKAFQTASGLTADGLAGPRTQMMLNGAVPSPGTPVLKAVSEDNG